MANCCETKIIQVGGSSVTDEINALTQTVAVDGGGPGNNIAVALSVDFDNANYVVELEVPEAAALVDWSVVPGRLVGSFVLRTSAAVPVGSNVFVSGMRKVTD